MSVLDTPELVPVPVGYCPCAGRPHPDGDVVYLHPELSMSGGMAARSAIADGMGDSIKLQELLARVWIGHGVAEWTFLDDDGKPIPLTPANIARALPYAKGGRSVADKADDLYNEEVLAPFKEGMKELERLAKEATKKLRKPSQPGSIPSSPPAISPATTSPKKRPSPSSTPATDKVPPAE